MPQRPGEIIKHPMDRIALDQVLFFEKAKHRFPHTPARISGHDTIFRVPGPVLLSAVLGYYGLRYSTDLVTDMKNDAKLEFLLKLERRDRRRKIIIGVIVVLLLGAGLIYSQIQNLSLS